MKLFVGLGNPGTKYQNTRHNLGQIIISEFIKQNNLSLKNQPKLLAQIADCKGKSCACPTIFAISSDYMNNSGLTVQKISHYYKIKPEDIYIVHDDLDIEVGDYKIQFDRGAAGHNGIKSTIEQLGTQAFNRIRVGIGKPKDSTPVENYVLQAFTPEELQKIKQVVPKIIQEIENIAT